MHMPFISKYLYIYHTSVNNVFQNPYMLIVEYIYE